MMKLCPNTTFTPARGLRGDSSYGGLTGVGDFCQYYNQGTPYSPESSRATTANFPNPHSQ